MTQIQVRGQCARVFRLLSLGVAASVMVTLAVPSAAQSVDVQRDAAQRDAAELQRNQQRIEQLRKQQEATPDVSGTLTAPTRLRLPSGEAPCFTIRQLELQGQDASQFGWVLDALAGPHNDDSPLRKCLGTQGIGLLLQRAQDAVIARGFVTTRVLAQPQDLSQGSLILTVVPGRVRTIRFEAPEQAHTSLTNAMPLRSGDILNLRDIEQALENLKRVPTADADIQITPADQPDASDLVVRYQRSTEGLAPLRVSLSADDSGAKSTGKYQGSATLSWDNPLGLNDLFYLTSSHDLGGGDPGARGTRGNTVHYSIPWGYWLLSTTATDSRYYQTVAGIPLDYVYSGTSGSMEIKLSRIVYRNSTDKTSVSLKAFERHSQNYIDDTEVQNQRRAVGGWELGLGHKSMVGASTWEANVAYRQGTEDFDSRTAPEESFGEGTSKMRLWTADLSVTAPFTLAGQALRYQGSLRLQGNDTPLTPQDRFSIGGRYTVRGFDGEGSLSGDSGWLLRNDISLPLGSSGHELYVGVDAGEVGGRSSMQQVGITLSGAVLGLRGNWRGLQYECFVGAPLDKPNGFKTSESAAGFSVNYAF
jgi:hemolysin activation/secretion protein